MTSVYRTLTSSAFDLYFYQNKTLSAADFLLQSDEIGFQDKTQGTGILKAFGNNAKLNRQFNAFYQEAKAGYDQKFDGDAHLLLQSAALCATIMANRKLFPSDEIKLTVALKPDDIRGFTIPSTLAMAGRLFKEERERFLAEFEKGLAEARQRKEAESAVPDDAAKKASDTLLGMIVEQQKAAEGAEGDPLTVLLKDVLDDRSGAADGSGSQSAETSLAERSSVQAVAKVIAKAGSASADAVNAAYAEH